MHRRRNAQLCFDVQIYSSPLPWITKTVTAEIYRDINYMCKVQPEFLWEKSSPRGHAFMQIKLRQFANSEIQITSGTISKKAIMSRCQIVKEHTTGLLFPWVIWTSNILSAFAGALKCTCCRFMQTWCTMKNIGSHTICQNVDIEWYVNNYGHWCFLCILLNM